MRTLQYTTAVSDIALLDSMSATSATTTTCVSNSYITQDDLKALMEEMQLLQLTMNQLL